MGNISIEKQYKGMGNAETHFRHYSSSIFIKLLGF